MPKEDNHLPSKAWHCLQINAGGSLANTLANMGRLSSASEADLSGRIAPLRVAAASIVGTDAMGSFHSAQQQKAGVTTLSHPIPDSCTGKAMLCMHFKS